LEEIIMFKKIMSVMLAIVMLMSVAMIATSAAQVEIADNSADAVADVAADGSADTGADGEVADTGSGNVLNFDTANTGWQNYKYIGFHVWAYGGDSFYAWGAKGQRGTDSDGDGIWTYDLDAKGVTIEPGQLYAVIFYADTGMQTHDLLFDSSVIGDTAYVDASIMYENMADSNKTSVGAFWQGQDPTTFGPVKGITSIGNVVGTCIPSTTTPQAMFETFLTDTLENARTYSGKDDQTLIDDTAKAIGLKQDDVEAAIKNTGASVQWDKSKSTLEAGTNPEAGNNPSNPSNNNSNNNSNKNTSTTKTGSGSTTKTGQESTILFIMLGVMLAAAGVVVLARKERA
jgi:LPXTG-motif cell wall-anchored protein